MTWAVIFDVDGVLVDSAEAHFESWAMLARERDVPFGRDVFARTFGRTSRSILLEEFDSTLADEAIAQLDGRKEALYREIVRDNFPAMPGAVKLIDDLHHAGALLAAGSSGPPENVQLALDQLGRADCFGAAITGMDVTRGKPDPQVFLLAAKAIGIEPSRCVVIEDAPVGIAAAHAAGMQCVALVSSGRSADELTAADLVVDSLFDLRADIVRNLIGR